MSTRIRLEYFGMPGEGATVKEAKQDAGRKIEQALSGTYSPRVFCHAGYTLIVFRMPPENYAYTITTPEDDGYHLSSCHSSGNEAEVIRLGRKHLAQYLIGKTPQNGLEVIQNQIDFAEHERDIRRVTLYRQYLDGGMSIDEAHELSVKDSRS